MSDMHIPKTLHFVWVGDPIPSGLAANVVAWKERHPEWSVRVWSEDDLYGLENQALFDRAADIVPRDAVEQFRADIARYEILHRHGGFYADVDTYPLRDITPALAGHTAFAAAEDRTWIGNTYLGAVPEHPIFRDLIERLPVSVERSKGRRPNRLSGPRFLTPIWKRRNGFVAGHRLWFPYSYDHVRRDQVPKVDDPDVFAVHQWDHTRRVMAERSRR